MKPNPVMSGAAKAIVRLSVFLALALLCADCPLRANPIYWIDSDTKLMWTLADNGSGLSRSQAIRYCRELNLAGFKDWTLPSIDDLQGIFDNSQNEGTYHVRGPFKLSGWQWSNTPGTQEGEGWAFDFGDGGRASVAAGDSGLNRALCIRHVTQ
jgi:hypothetical protein